MPLVFNYKLQVIANEFLINVKCGTISCNTFKQLLVEGQHVKRPGVAGISTDPFRRVTKAKKAKSSGEADLRLGNLSKYSKLANTWRESAAFAKTGISTRNVLEVQ